jgi:mono/diheme cytochrome c family protein
MRLPAGTFIDASRPDAWEFPRGTRLWKEFSQGRRVETRLIERLADGSWRFVAYAWNEEGTDAVLVPEDGVTVDVAGAPGGRYAVPSRTDCLACHEGASVPVLGFSALQLSPDRDDLAPHAERASVDYADLRGLVERGLVRNLPRSMLDVPPRIAAATPIARAALGYLHANCGHCHNDTGALLGVDMVLSQRVDDPLASEARVLKSLVGRGTRFRARDTGAVKRLVPGHPDASLVSVRMRTTNPLARMPPVGVEVVDDEGAALVERWIQHTPEEP